MSDPFVAEIRLFPYEFAPTGWAFCNGQLLPISQNMTLYTLLGTTYGGDGESTFALPNLKSRVALHPGAGPGLTQRFLGEKGGRKKVALTQEQMPAHKHALRGTGEKALSKTPTDRSFAKTDRAAYGAPDRSTTFTTRSVSPTGAGDKHDNLQPYLVLHYCIALEGVYPPSS